MIKSLSQWLFLLSMFGWAASAAAHTYFFGLTDISVNPNNHQLEIIHQFTGHDIENAIAQSKQINFSPEHAQYEQLIQAYIESHFHLQQHNQAIALKTLGSEYESGKIYIYQEASKVTHLAGIKVNNAILMDVFPKQVNTVNYQDGEIKGSLTFMGEQQSATITKDSH